MTWRPPRQRRRRSATWPRRCGSPTRTNAALSDVSAHLSTCACGPQFHPDLLLDKDKGMSSVYRNFPKLKFKGKGHEVQGLPHKTSFDCWVPFTPHVIWTLCLNLSLQVADLRRLINKYAEWGHILVPKMEFTCARSLWPTVAGDGCFYTRGHCPCLAGTLLSALRRTAATIACATSWISYAMWRRCTAIRAPAAF